MLLQKLFEVAGLPPQHQDVVGRNLRTIGAKSMSLAPSTARIVHRAHPVASAFWNLPQCGFFFLVLQKAWKFSFYAAKRSGMFDPSKWSVVRTMLDAKNSFPAPKCHEWKMSLAKNEASCSKLWCKSMIGGLRTIGRGNELIELTQAGFSLEQKAKVSE